MSCLLGCSSAGSSERLLTARSWVQAPPSQPMYTKKIYMSWVYVHEAPQAAAFIWRRGRVVDCTSLENWQSCKWLLGSNPSASAKKFLLIFYKIYDIIIIENKKKENRLYGATPYKKINSLRRLKNPILFSPQ